MGIEVHLRRGRGTPCASPYRHRRLRPPAPPLTDLGVANVYRPVRKLLRLRLADASTADPSNFSRAAPTVWQDGLVGLKLTAAVTALGLAVAGGGSSASRSAPDASGAPASDQTTLFRASNL